MLESSHSRILAIGLLVAVFLGLCVWYGSLPPDPEAGAYPDEDDLVHDYDAYVGDRAVVSGYVVGTDPIRIAITSRGGERLRLTVTGVSEPVAEGDIVRVYGVVEPDDAIRASTAIVVDPWGYRYAYGVSFLAGLWVLGRFVRHWRIDGRALGFRTRSRSPGAATVRRGDGDA